MPGFEKIHRRFLKANLKFSIYWRYAAGKILAGR
jgi:hypothetical protein